MLLQVVFSPPHSSSVHYTWFCLDSFLHLKSLNIKVSYIYVTIILCPSPCPKYHFPVPQSPLQGKRHLFCIFLSPQILELKGRFIQGSVQSLFSKNFLFKFSLLLSIKEWTEFKNSWKKTALYKILIVWIYQALKFQSAISLSLRSIENIFLRPHLPRLIFPPFVGLSVCGKNTSLDTHTHAYSLSVSVSLQ